MSAKVKCLSAMLDTPFDRCMQRAWCSLRSSTISDLENGEAAIAIERRALHATLDDHAAWLCRRLWRHDLRRLPGDLDGDTPAPCCHAQRRCFLTRARLRCRAATALLAAHVAHNVPAILDGITAHQVECFAGSEMHDSAVLAGDLHVAVRGAGKDRRFWRNVVEVDNDVRHRRLTRL